MQIRSRTQAPLSPRTHVGRWLLAVLLDQQEEGQRLSRELNNGRQGWNYDEPAVVGYICELAVRRVFPGGLDALKITAFIDEMRSRVSHTAPPGQAPVGERAAESLIRDALRDPDADVSNLDAMTIFTTHGAILAHAVRKLSLSQSGITQLIIEGEKIAFKEGWKPSLV